MSDLLELPARTIPKGPPWPAKDHCMDCGVELEFDPVFAGTNRCVRDAIAAGNEDPRRFPRAS